MGRITRSRVKDGMVPNDITVLSAFQGVPSTSAHDPYVTKFHHHAQGVFNVLLVGRKTWVLYDYCRPGRHDVPRRVIIQEEGEWLWLPPGWEHSVTSHDGRSFEVQKGARRTNKTAS